MRINIYISVSRYNFNRSRSFRLLYRIWYFGKWLFSGFFVLLSRREVDYKILKKSLGLYFQIVNFKYLIKEWFLRYMHAYPKKPKEPNTSYMYLFCLIHNTVIEGCIFGDRPPPLLSMSWHLTDFYRWYGYKAPGLSSLATETACL